MTTEPRPSDPLENIVLPEKKKRVKKRFTSKEKIISKIDLFTKRKQAKEEEIRQLLREERTFREAAQQTSDNPDIIRSAQRIERKVDKVGKRVIVLDRKLSNLKERLAEFQTDTIPGITDDRSVQGI